MSAQPIEHAPVLEAPPDLDGPSRASAPPEPAEAFAAFQVRRNALVSGLLGIAAAGIGTAYLGRAVGTGSLLDWVLCVVLGSMAVAFLRGLLDSRTPLLVADELGLRIRLGAQWRGFPWEAIDRVLVTPRRGLLRDGRLVVQLLNPQRAMEGLEGRALRHARLNRTVYGATLAVPLGLTTRTSGGGSSTDPAGDAGAGDLGERVGALSRGRTEVVTLLDTLGTPLPAGQVGPLPLDESEGRGERVPAERRPRWRRRPADTDRPAAPEAGERDEVTLAAPVVDTAAASRRVLPLARLGDPVEPVVIAEFEPQPAYDPVIGPELAAARTRVGLSVDELADRTRIRPHVIESLEVDDFAPCGGDFYARGHIRTLARVLGKDPEPLLAAFEARYASAPVTARSVFEAELATGLTGTIRGTGVRGPNWALLVGVVLLLVLVWSAVRLLAGDGGEVLETPPPVLDGSAGLSSGYGEARTTTEPVPVPTTVTAVDAGAHVEIRDGEGSVVFEGDLVIGEVARVEATPPVTVSTDDGGAVSVEVGGHDQGFLGEPDQPATRVFQRPDA